jgi:Carboxypeptidase regulatory-like domain
MTSWRVFAIGLIALSCIPLISQPALAQQTSAIAGIVRDTSGGVLPGVTVEAASPVLIEKVRTVVTDDQGRYNIVDLRPGTYRVTFTLPGFNTLVREGVELTSGFTAAVNAELPVGALQETVTVSGETPLVDTQNVRRQTLLTRDLLDALPTSTKNWATIVEVTPGFSGSFADVAGQLNQNIGNAYHGKTGTKRQFDGMSIDHASGNVGYLVNSAMVEEISLQSSGISAESNADGSVVNMIPKEGSNSFAGTLSGLYTSDRFESSNLNDDLRSRGLTTISKILKIYDTGVTLGGPIKKDKLWFFASFREWGNQHLMAGNFWNKTQGTPFYTPDLSHPADRAQWYESKAARVTWQAAQKHKFNFFADVADDCLCRAIGALGSAPEAGIAFHFRPVGLYQADWSAPITPKLLFEAGGSLTITHWPTFLNPGVQPSHISILELSNNFRYNASATYASKRATDRGAQRFSISYVTGSHAYKFGTQIEEAVSDVVTYVQGNVNYSFRNGVPTSITQYATPYRAIDRTRADMGVYFQDQWAMRRLTLNYGVRFDYFNGHVDANHLAAPESGWVPARDFGAVSGVPAWKDINPRFGASYDLFGNGKTALKASIGRYVAKTGTAVASANNPVTTSVNSITRTWGDANGNYVPDCDLKNRAANGECGPMSDANFGGLSPTTHWADDVLRGWGVRNSNWDVGTEIQHQLRDGVSLTAGYYRNWYGNFTATDNLLRGPSDFDSYCVTAPLNPNLPGGGGYQVCGMSDVSVAKFTQVDNLVTQSSRYGKQKQVNNFFNFGINTRLRGGASFGGGIDTGRTMTDNCFVVDAPGIAAGSVTAPQTATTVSGISNASPTTPQASTTINGKPLCHVVTPFGGQTQLKLNGAVPLPYEFIVSGIWQDISGPNIVAAYAASNAEVSRSLGRDLGACGGRTPCTATATVPLVMPGSMYDHRIRRLDVRVTKQVRLTPRLRMQGNLDIYNVFNGGSAIQINNAFGPQWRQPTEVQDPRILQFSAQLNF